MRKLSYHKLEKKLIVLKSKQNERLKKQEYKIFFDNMADISKIIALI
jgi:hypothetical protein